MATYRINFIATYAVAIKAASDQDARIAADTMAESGRRDLLPPIWKIQWNTIERQDGADD